ncbi:PASTA domain-containing protein [Desulforhopalus singaporensis]|uniref:beta-lactamase n=1 Tax=Desulforhopalus singaporensis TaxID=91360 RepID=A0A1H0UKH3_9BACT|nr:PASTA domain-containing protein [Desulforhopalus singaporensis]SDP66593.1 cell division protein FtsI (penicillin-binding protein 3) [Desulforhopalus singaporensis]
MTKQSLLRIRKNKKGRRGVLCLGLLAVLVVVMYSLISRYHVAGYLLRYINKPENGGSSGILERGTIYDRNLKQLAVTLDRVAVFVRTREVESISDTAISLASILSLDANKLIDQLESGVLRFWVAEDISEEQEIEIRKLNLPGVHFQQEGKRYYPNDLSAAHVVGYVADGTGLSGVEYYYDRLLASRKLKAHQAGKVVSTSQNLVLTVNLKIQRLLDEIARDIAAADSGAKVSAYLVEGETGELIGGSQFPGFDPNNFTKYTRAELENLFFTELYLPDAFRLFLKDCAVLFGEADSGRKVLAWSLSPSPESLGIYLRFWDLLRLGERTATDFYRQDESPGESDPGVAQKLPLVSDDVDFALIPEMTTPFRLLTAYSAILEGGLERTPHAVKYILDTKTGEEIDLGRQGAGNFLFDPRLADSTREMKQLFKSRVDSSHSSALYLRDRVVVAETTDLKGKYEVVTDDVTFVAIPAGEKDLYLLVVCRYTPEYPLPEGKGPIPVEEVIDRKVGRIAILHQVAQTVADVVEPEPGEQGNYQGQKVEGEDKRQGTVSDKDLLPAPLAMPDLKGLSLRKSLRMLQGADVEIKIKGTGRVVDQEPPPGTSLEKIKTCRLILEQSSKMRLDKMRKTRQGQ